MKKIFAILLAMIVLCCATALADESELTVSGIGKVRLNQIMDVIAAYYNTEEETEQE